MRAARLVVARSRCAGAADLRALALAACLAQLGSCGARHAERPDAMPSTVAADASAEAGADAGRQLSACPVQRAGRTFVGFSEGMSLDDFELAAFEAERIVAAVRVQLCELDDTRDSDGSLRAALRTSAIEITSIVFTQDDAGAADVQVRQVQNDMSMSTSAAPAVMAAVSWSLQLVREAGIWRIVAAAPV